MPANKKMGRVIITPDSYVHIVLKDRKSYKCTPNCLMYLLKDPVAFMDEAPRLFVNTTSEVNPSYEDLEDIVGLTLACFYEDRRFECFFPELFVELFRQMSLSTDFGLGFNA